MKIAQCQANTSQVESDDLHPSTGAQSLWAGYYAMKLIAVSSEWDDFSCQFHYWYKCIAPLGAFESIVENATGKSFEVWVVENGITPEDYQSCRRKFRDAGKALMDQDHYALSMACQNWLKQNALHELLTQQGMMSNVILAGDVFALSALEIEIIRVCFLRELDRSFNGLFTCTALGLNVERADLLKLLGAMLGNYSHWEVRAALADTEPLKMLGLVNHMKSYGDLDDLIYPGHTLELLSKKAYRDSIELMQSLLPMSATPKLETSAFIYMEADFQRALNWIQFAHQRQSVGVNILLHGVAGTGKTEFARLLCAQSNSVASELVCVDERGRSATLKERLAGFNIAQIHLKQMQSPVLIVDEAEDIFPARASVLWSDADYSKAWMNRLLENNCVPAIWISNNVSEIDPAYLRRFGMTIEFKQPPKLYREQWLRQASQGIPLSEKSIATLASDDKLNVAHIEQIIRVASECNNDQPEKIESTVVDMMQRTRKLFGANAMPPVSQLCSNYHLDWLNIEGVQDIAALVSALKLKGKGRLCFYGVPGSGKTQLAQYIADQLNKPLHAQRVSDLSSMWVGEAEKNIAKAFEQAQAEGAVLLLDECDSFLKDRAGAERNWQQTQTNEFLQQMERFSGIFIATTNFYDLLDPAILRRFQFKLNFQALTLEQRITVFSFYFPYFAVDNYSRSQLMLMEGLVPADFALVAEQSEWLGQLEVEKVIHALGVEFKAKRAIQSGKIGFL